MAYDKIIDSQQLDTNLTSIANSIRTAGDLAPTAKLQFPGDFKYAIDHLMDNKVVAESLSVSENGTYTAPSGKAYSPITVAVPSAPSVEVEALNVTENGTYTAPTGKAYSPVTVAVPSSGGELTLLASGTYTKTNEATDNTKLEIPVTVSGTVQGILVYAETPVSGVAQAYGWWRNWLVPQKVKDLFGNNSQMSMLYKSATGNPTAQPQNTNKVEINAEQTTVTVSARDGIYVVRDNTYKWELWGIA